MSKIFSDKEIIEHIKMGDTDAVLNYLYDNSQVKIRNWILQNNGSEEEAQDIFQDAILSLYNYVIQGRFEVGKSVEGFLFAVGRNAWINRAKQRKKMLTGETHMDRIGEIPDLESSEVNLDKDQQNKIDQLLNQLGEKCKQLLTYSIFYDMRMDEIAKKMEFAGANVAKTKNYKCKKRLMKIIEENKIVDLKTWIYQ